MSKALVIGASRGIGLEFVRQYRAESWEVTATARTDAGLQLLASLGARSLELDVTDPRAPGRLVESAEGARWDVVLYVAGAMSRGTAAAAQSVEEFDRIMRANVFGAVQIIPAVAPLIAPGGRFACVSSLLGSIAGTESSSTWLYRISKAALNMAVHASQSSFPEIVFLALAPGWVRTDMGGPSAPLAVDRSVAGMRKVLATAGRGEAGAFIDHEGRRVAW
jgi:NAD(P)-dependent dehydrogenase (short-subunit alcohol dehydrogenase family)